MKRLSFLSFLLFSCSILFHQINLCHGFSENTRICMASSTESRTIREIYENIDDGEFFIKSYSFSKSYCIEREVLAAARGMVNCYVKMKFDDNASNDIICSPAQMFYETTHKKWTPAYKLKKGDLLLSKCHSSISITNIEFVKQSIEMYMLNIGCPHNFLVGRYAVLTHNMAMSLGMSFWIEFGKGASAGTAASSEFGPLCVGIGVGIGLLYAGYRLATAEKKASCDWNFDADGFDEEFHNNDNTNTNSESSYQNANDNDGDAGGQSYGNAGSFGGSAAGGAPSPEDPEDPRGPKNSGSNSQSTKGSQSDNRPDKEILKEIKSLEENIKKHFEKLKDYRKNPDAYDNQNHLKKAGENLQRRSDIINGRIKHIYREISDWTNTINSNKAELIKRGFNGFNT